MIKFVRMFGLSTFALGWAILLAGPAAATTVFPSGTIFQEAGLITSTDPSTFQSATAATPDTGTRNMFDRRTAAFADYSVFLFDAIYSNGFTIEIQVNAADFTTVADAQVQADIYGLEIGRLPSVLLRDVDAVWIHAGVELFGGGNRSLLIHTGQSAAYTADGILEETLVHEAVHTSLDADHAAAAGWVQAQTDDGMFVSPYARDNPTREDLAESFLMYLGARHLSGRMNPDDVIALEAGIGNRLDYFDKQDFDLGPLVKTTAVPLPPGAVLALTGLGVLALLRRRKAVRPTGRIAS